MKIIENVFLISGMTCKSCEVTLARALRNCPGVKSVRVSYIEATANIKYDENVLKKNDIIGIIEKEGYGIGKKNGLSELVYMGLFILVLYILIKNTIGFNVIPQVEQTMGFGLLLVVGVLTSFHCVAMCGGINLSTCITLDDLEENEKTTVLPSILYNSGRVVAYTIIGAVVGGIGSIISYSDVITKSISVVAGMFMILMGLKMLNMIPALKHVHIGFPTKIRKGINKKKPRKSPFVVGLLNGLMPCGPLQSMQLYALGTGSMIEGGLSMFFFSVGTVPLMFGFGTLGSYITGRLKQQMTKFSALLVIVLGLIMANRGLGLSFSLDTSKGTKAVMSEGIQTVETTFTSGEYKPITVEKGTEVEWVIHVKEGELNGCNYRLIIEEYVITKELQEGTNTIRFTPNESGSFTYTCWMRMIRSKIYVVDKL